MGLNAEGISGYSVLCLVTNMTFKYGVTLSHYVTITLPVHARQRDTNAPTLCWRTNSTKTEAKICPIKSVIKVKVKEFRNRPGVAKRVPGGLGSQIFMTFGTWRWWGCQPHAPAVFTPRECSWYSFSLGGESIPGPWNGWKEHVTEKSSDTSGNRSRDHPTSSAAP